MVNLSRSFPTSVRMLGGTPKLLLPTCLCGLAQALPHKPNFSPRLWEVHYLNVSPGHPRPSAPEKVLPGLSCGVGSWNLCQQQLRIPDREVSIMVRVEKLEIPVKLRRERKSSAWIPEAACLPAAFLPLKAGQRQGFLELKRTLANSGKVPRLPLLPFNIQMWNRNMSVCLRIPVAKAQSCTSCILLHKTIQPSC